LEHIKKSHKIIQSLLHYSLVMLFLLVASQSLHSQNLARIYGKVTDTLGIPIERVNIIVKEEENLGISTSESGRYDLLIPHDKDITVEIRCVGFLTQIYKVNVSAGSRKLLNIKLIQTEIALNPFIFSQRRTMDDGIEKLSPKTIKSIPGYNSGVEHLVKIAGLGVSPSTEMTSQYNVRGGNYDENLIYLNGIEVYRPFLIRSGQQEGLSFINPDMVSSVKFSSGGFDACYGDRMSSVLDVNYKKPLGFGGSLSASLLGASTHLEGATKDQKLTALFGVRYQTNAYIFRQMQVKGHYKPNFTDGQLLLTYTPAPKWELSLFGNYARNEYLLIPDTMVTRMSDFSNIKEFKVFYTGQEVDAYQTMYAAFIAKYAANENTDLRFSLSYFNSVEKETFDLEAQYYINDIKLDVGKGKDEDEEILNSQDVGSELRHARNFLTSHIFHGEFQGEHRLKKRNNLTWGLKFQGELIDDKLSEWRLFDSSGYSLPNSPTYPGETVPLDDSSRIITMGDNYLLTTNTIETFRLSGFVQDRWTFGDSIHRFSLIGGIRFSYWTFNHNFILTPRVRLVYQPNMKVDMSFFVATGMYFQPPFYKEFRMSDGTLNENIKPQKSYHVIVGMDYLFKIARRPFKLSAELYYKYLQDLITYTMDNVRIIYSGENDAVGHVLGFDAKLSGEIVNNLESWFAVSIMRSDESINGAGFTPRPTDQRLSMNLFFQDKVPKLPMLKAHISLIYSTPLPYSSPYVRNYQKGIYHYFKADIGFSWQFVDETTRFRDKNPFKFLKAGYLTFEVSNIFNFKNLLSYSWISNMEGNYYMMPNYLTPRLFNVKVRFEF